MRAGLWIAAVSLALAGCAKAPSPAISGVTDAMIANPPAGEWLTYGRTPDEQRFSPLDAIGAGNVGRLGLAAVVELGAEDRVIHRQGAAGERTEAVENCLGLLLRGGAVDEGCHDDRPRVDHRVHRPAGLRLQADGVEGIARRLHADGASHRVHAAVFQRDAIDQRLGDRLDGEFCCHVT